MPVVFPHEGFRFVFYSSEGQPPEPVHVHVRSAQGEAKFWVVPAVHLADSHGVDAVTLRELTAVVRANAALIEEAWNDHFG